MNSKSIISRLGIIGFLLFQSYFVVAQPKAIDGFFDDWTSSDFSISDNDNADNLDIQSVSVADDEDRLYIRIILDREIDLQDEEDITVFIDADNNPETGFTRDEIGAEITYFFENRRGFINAPNGDFVEVNHSPLGVISLPTFTSNQFELAFDKSVSENGISAIMGSTIKIRIENDFQGDVVPNSGGGFEYTMTTAETDVREYTFDKNSNDVRLMSYNVNRGFFEPDKSSSIEAVITAMNPDILALQEVNDITAAQVIERLNVLLPTSQGWDAAKVFPDIIVATKFQVEAFDPIDGNGVFLIIDNDNNPYIIYNLHLPCCDNDNERQLEIDRILSVLRDRENAPEIGFFYGDEVPTIITGDFNLVGLAQNYTSFVEGDIVSNTSFGNDFGPDWDGSTLEDATPYVTNFPSNYTWNNPTSTSGYNPGRLDFVFYTGSVMDQRNAFVLDTDRLTPEDLSGISLNADATAMASDHCPLVFDFQVAAFVDADGDGFTSDIDCDDNDLNVFPGATEVCDNIDNNCNNLIDEGLAQTFFLDVDNDGFGDASAPIMSCLQPSGAVANSDDCNDGDASINPAAIEISNNGVDENCDGVSLIIDIDMDGINSSEDCDDNNASVYPGATEVCDDLDNDCDGIVDEDVAMFSYFIDQDRDGYGVDDSVILSCMQPSGTVTIGGDCDDSDATIHPSATEIPNNSIDEDCDGVAFMIDSDLDGFNSSEDCNDADATIYPNAAELCDGFDNDCDGIIDEDVTLIPYFIDFDSDGYGMDASMVMACAPPSGFVILGGDCNDNDPAINPSALEIPNNNIDENCDGIIEVIDVDGDSYNSDEDCDDNNTAVNPGAPEECDNLDNNCNGSIDEGLSFVTYFLDADMDGFGADNTELMACLMPVGYVAENGDCDDTNPNVNPDAIEIPYNGLDDDCDPDTLEDDLDQDGFLFTDDCDDNNDSINPNATEIPNNGIDEDCDGMDLTSAIHELAQAQLNIFPNPAVDIIYIDVIGELNYHASLFDLNGKLIYQSPNASKIELESFPEGTYFLEIKDIKSNQQVVEKIIIGR